MVDFNGLGRVGARTDVPGLPKSDIKAAGQLADKFSHFLQQGKQPDAADTDKAKQFINTVKNVTSPDKLLALATQIADAGHGLNDGDFDKYASRIAQNVEAAETAAHRLRTIRDALKN